jgi:hypothetical protein
MEGTITGSFDEMTVVNGLALDTGPATEQIDHYGEVDASAGFTPRPTTPRRGPTPTPRPSSNGASR